MKFLCEQCKAKYQIADEKAVGKTVRMKCRKCGHLIEVRAAVTETSVSSALPEHTAPASAILTEPPAPPSTTMLAGPLTAPGPKSPKPERPASALEGAFKNAVQQEAHAAAASAAAPRAPTREGDEPSTPFDMSDLSANDEWYVAINGVPVGPIRVAEVRRKAALGAVTEDSLAWQEGLDEWRPLRTFPELAASIREAMSRVSRPPPAEVRISAPPPPPRSAARPLPAPASANRGLPPRAAPQAPGSSPSGVGAPPVSPAAARSNVVPIMSRLATAEKLEPTLVQRASPVPPAPAAVAPMAAVAPSVAPDPFAAAFPGAIPAAPAVPVITAPSVLSSAPPPSKKPIAWIPIALVAMAIAFGITAAIALFTRAPAPPSTPVAEQPTAQPSAAATAAPGTPSPTTTVLSADTPDRPAATATATARAPSAPRAAATAATTGAAANTAAASAATNNGRSLDLHSITQAGGSVAPTDDPGGGDSPKTGSGGGATLSESQVLQVLAAHRAGVMRGCWDRNPTSKTAVNVVVTLNVAPDGSAQNVAATGDDPSVAKCIENDVRNWHFPAGSTQQVKIPFKFVRQ